MNRSTGVAAIGLFLFLAACAPVEHADTAITSNPIPGQRAALAPAPLPRPTGTATAAPNTTDAPVPSTPVRSATAPPGYTPGHEATASPTAVPWPHLADLPAAPSGWRWRLHATAIPVTHYMLSELSPEIMDGPRERPYGIDDEPLTGVEALPRQFLLETAYQGAGLLPGGDILEFAILRRAVKAGHVPYRYQITPADRCAGHPLAADGTCSIPYQTAATTLGEGDDLLVPLGSTIFIPELDSTLTINDVSLGEGPPKIDLYTGTTNNYDSECPDGATIWILARQ